MKHLFSHLFIALSLCFFESISAQPRFSNQKIQDIYQQVSDKNGVHKSIPIVIETDDMGVITHIGVQLFDRTLCEASKESQLLLFAERYILELMLLDDFEISAKLKHQKVSVLSDVYPIDFSVKESLQAILTEPSLISSVQITRHKNRYALVCYKDDKVLLSLLFPANRELITAHTNLESEQSLLWNLHIISQSPQSTTILQTDELYPYKDGLFYAHDRYYKSEEMRSISYYVKQGGEYEAVVDPKYPEESVCNFFNAFGLDSGVVAKLTFSLYDGETTSYEVPTHMISELLRKEGCQIYTGIKKMTRLHIEGTVIAVNHELGYCHLLMFSTNREILNNTKDYKIKAKMYCYTPIHNILD